MKALITGAGGQVGWELTRSVPDGVTIRACTSQDLDITDRGAVVAIMAELQPDVVINAAAYTKVDLAETERERAFAVNGAAVSHLAAEAAKGGCRLLHISTDSVFDGTASRPWQPTDQPNPINVYGASKLAGEEAILATSGLDAMIVRTSWVYSAHGHNFVKTMLRLLGERELITVVDDQVGSPTHAAGLAKALWQCAARKDLTGIYHFSDAGVASWYDFAQAIAEEALALGLLETTATVKPIPGSDYPRAAPQPSYAVLDKARMRKAIDSTPKHWRSALREMLQLMVK